LPGTYTTRLTANGKTYSAQFTVKMDPRVKISSASLEKKFQLETRLAALVTQTSKAVSQAGSIREPLQNVSQQAKGATLESIQAFEKKLSAIIGPPAGSAPTAANEITLTRVNSQIATLYGQIWQADAEPTVAQSEAAAMAEHDATDLTQRWNALKTSGLPALNRALRAANLPEMQIESDARKDEALMDEE
jgi:hypothetical protein